MRRATIFGICALLALLSACTNGDEAVSDTPSAGSPGARQQASETAASPSPSAAPSTSPTPAANSSASPGTTFTPAANQPTAAASSTQQQPTSTPTLAPGSTPGASSTPSGTNQGRVVSPDPVFQVFVDAAAADLMARLAIGPGAITVAETKAVMWNDGGMGCPRPGMNYIQAVQDGVFIRLVAGGKSYPYHQGGSRPIFLCEQDVR